jgi:hypothetical protein
VSLDHPVDHPDDPTGPVSIRLDRRPVRREHGYLDEWAPDGTFHYTGRGQRGDQTLTGGNRAILNHAADGRALRVFQGSGGEVQYVGQFVLDEHDPYDWRTAPSTASGPPRKVVRFHLRPVDRPPAVPAGQPVGAPYQELDEDVEMAPPSTPAPVDPDAAGRGVRAHRALQNRLSRLIRAAGYAPLRPTPVDPNYDLAWSTPQALVVVEVKSCTTANEVHQLRMGIGQVLDYEDSLRSRGHSVQPVLYIEHAPNDSRWRNLAGQHGTLLAWPGTEHELFHPPSS